MLRRGGCLPLVQTHWPACSARQWLGDQPLPLCFAVDGIFQAPAGYVQADTGVIGNDGTPVSAKEQIYVLVNQNVDGSTTKKYKYLFTTN